MLKRIASFFIGYSIGALIALALFGLSRSCSADDVVPGIAILRNVALKIVGTSCSGSGSVIEGASGKHYILTNAHVCNCSRYRGEINGVYDGGKLIVGKEIKRDWAVDLCVAQIQKQPKSIKLAPSILPLMTLHTRGYPGGSVVESSGRAMGESEWTYDQDIADIGECPKGSQRMVTLQGNLGACRFTFTSSRTNLYGRPGSSGSAVVNNEGYLVGVISSWMPGEDYDAGVVPYDQVAGFLKGL